MQLRCFPRCFQGRSHSPRESTILTRRIGIPACSTSEWCFVTNLSPSRGKQNLCRGQARRRERVHRASSGTPATKDPRPLKGARALRVTARRHRKETPLSFAPSGNRVAGRERVQERGQRTCRARRQTIRYQMAGSRSHRVQCHSN